MSVFTFPPPVSPQLDGEGLGTGSCVSLPSSLRPHLLLSSSSPSVTLPPPSYPGRALVASLPPTSSPSPSPADSSTCFSLSPPLLFLSVPKMAGTEPVSGHSPLSGSLQQCLYRLLSPGLAPPSPSEDLLEQLRDRAVEHVPAVQLLRKPLPWLPAWVAFVSLSLHPAESPPLSGKRRRRQERTNRGGEERW